MKRYRYPIIVIVFVLGMILLVLYRFNYGHIKDTNGKEDFTLQEVDLSDSAAGISNYSAWMPDIREESNYSLFSSSKVTGVVTLRTTSNPYMKFDVDVQSGNCEIVVMDHTRTIVYTVNIDGTSSILLPETSSFYYVVMGVESADVTVTVQSGP